MVVGDFAIDLKTVVVGAGPGGYTAAIRAAKMGQKVTVIEREFIGGVCRLHSFKNFDRSCASLSTSNEFFENGSANNSCSA